MTIQFDEASLSDIPSPTTATRAFPKIKPIKPAGSVKPLPTTGPILSWYKTGVENVAPELREQVRQYRRWLTQQSTHKSDAQERAAYAIDASRVVQVNGKEVATFAPFRPELSALQTFTVPQLLTICALILAWTIGVAYFQLAMLTATIAAITVVYAFNLVLNSIMAVKSFQHSPEEQIDDAIVHALQDADWPSYTILCPLYKEAAVVPQFVQAMQALDYPADKLQILFLTEVDDVETRNAIRALALPAHFEIITVPEGKPRTKPRACNYGLIQATGSYVVIFDAEDVPDTLQLKKTVLTFANHGPDVACVQAKLNFYNISQNLLTRWFTAEYSLWFDLVLPGLQQVGFSIPLGGTSNHFRTKALRALGGWDAYNVTEDCDLGLRLTRYRFKTVVLNSTTYEEANSQVKNWLRQRSRWIKGYMQTYLVHMRNPLRYFQEGRQNDLFSFHAVVASGVGVLFLNPLMWLLLAIYVAFGPLVTPTYHVLFPAPVLYAGAMCLIFGNFFYMYLYLLACMRRKQYTLMVWVLFIPLYWAMISVAGFIALFELLVKPHYWQKTVHGLHLQGKHTVQPVTLQNVVEQEEETVAQTTVTTTTISNIADIPSVAHALKALTTLPMPAISVKQQHARSEARRSRVRDLWFVATLVTACITSIAACVYFFQKHEILLYGDAYSHMRIARSMFDSATPGVAQLGGVWLPLPHLLMLPFIWNNYLWTSGLAGSFVSMGCYIASAAFLYLSLRRLTKNGAISFLGTLLFLLNPNILYLQSTPLSELVCIWTLTMASYYFLLWTQEDKPHFLIMAAAATFLATLARYDGWALFAMLLVLVGVIGVAKRQRLAQIQGNLIIFGVLGGLGILLWLIWNKLIFGDPLFFQHSVFSSQGFQLQFMHNGTLYAYHNALIALKTYTFDAMETFGPVLFIAAIAAFFLFFVRRRVSPDLLAVLAFVAPFALYVFSIYGGQAIVWVPGAVPAKAAVQLFNVRYGSEMVAPAALFLTVLVARGYTLLHARLKLIGQLAFISVILAQTLFVATNGIISLQDGQFGLSCTQTHVVNAYLIQHYAGGKILEDVTAGDYNEPETGIDFKNVIYDGSNTLWHQALANPAGTVDWIIAVNNDAGDRVSANINLKSSTFQSQFSMVVQEPSGLTLYHRNGTAPLPTRPLPASILTDHSACLIGTSVGV